MLKCSRKIGRKRQKISEQRDNAENRERERASEKRREMEGGVEDGRHSESSKRFPSTRQDQICSNEPGVNSTHQIFRFFFALLFSAQIKIKKLCTLFSLRQLKRKHESEGPKGQRGKMRSKNYMHKPANTSDARWKRRFAFSWYIFSFLPSSLSSHCVSNALNDKLCVFKSAPAVPLQMSNFVSCIHIGSSMTREYLFRSYLLITNDSWFDTIFFSFAVKTSALPCAH